MTESSSRQQRERVYRIVEVSDDELRGLRPDPGEVEPPPAAAPSHHHDMGTHHDHDSTGHHDHDHGGHHDHDHVSGAHHHHHPVVLDPDPWSS